MGLKPAELAGWDRLRHGGLLLDAARSRAVAEQQPSPLPPYLARELRRRVTAASGDGDGVTSGDTSAFVTFVLEQVCGFAPDTGRWLRGSQVPTEWGRRAITGETIKPRQLWVSNQQDAARADADDGGADGRCGAGILPVFIDTGARVGIGRGRRATSHVVQWLRAGPERLALLTNGRQWRLIFAGLDMDAWCEWDTELWLEEGELSPQVDALRILLQPALWTPATDGANAPLTQAILDNRKGQAELSAVLGERVREAVELLVQAHGDLLRERCADVAPADVYRAAVRMVMRLVVALFAESRDLLPRDNALYHGSYGVTGLIEELDKAAARSGSRLGRSYSAWPRLLALVHLIEQGSHHPELPVPAYGGELFAPGDAESPDGLRRALALFEIGCFERELLSDRQVHAMLALVTRTQIKLRQGRATTWVTAPVDFSDLSSEYIGILYEGLLDYELKTAPVGDPVVFLSVGNTPALPLSRLEAMDDKAIAGLLDKMKDTSSGGDEATGDEATGDEEIEDAAADEVADDAQEGDDETVDAAADAAGADAEANEHEQGDEEDVGDDRHTTRTRAEEWARKAVLAGGLVRAPRGAPSPEKRLAHEEAVARKARQLVERVVLPGEWYVVRWGGTRKGSGTFYTRPGLAVPTVQRTLRPLAFDPPTDADGSPNTGAPAIEWTPKPPDQILALKVCDPACGSGTFPVAALRYLTAALYESLIAHGRVSDEGERTLVRLIEPSDVGGQDERLADELLPCRPDDDTFEPRLKALLRRHVVERCIYGVDLDPLAVELCRLSLWIETMDRELAFSFLDHKVKCGNALVGAWFDTFRHFPVMAFKNREGGDKGHSNAVHFTKDARGKALRTFVKDVLTPDLRRYLGGRQLFDQRDPLEQASAVHDGALATLACLHGLPVQDTAERARVYHEELVGSPAHQHLKRAMDLWCACWFWPADRLSEAPLPTALAAPSESTAALAARIAAEKRFFHWELEFPDVFRTFGAGFDAVLGNPPWETLQPNSKEYFSNVDPLFRSYGKQEALRRQTEYFADDAVEQDWLDFNAGFANYSNWMKHAASPFGDPTEADVTGDRFAVARGNENGTFHDRWRESRAKSYGYSDPKHPFRHRGEGKAYTYKLFLEQAHALLREGGRLGFVVPSGLYSDHGTGGLRELFLDHCRWEWLFGFENRDKVFDIDSRFKFNAVVIEKGGRTDAIRTAFMRRALEDWERAEELAVPYYTREQVERFSPRSRAILEIQSARDLEILGKIYANSVLLGDDGPDGWGVTYAQGDFNMTSDSKLFPPRPAWEAKGYRPDEYSRWLLGDWRPIDELWAELGVDPEGVAPAEIELEDWLFDTSAGPERRVAEARFVYGHLLKPGDVARTEWRLRCAQPPYDSLPIPRADIPAGIILSRQADAWIREEGVEDTALPLYEGRMIGQFDFSQKGWVSGKGRSAVWRDIPWARKVIEPQYLMGAKTYRDSLDEPPSQLVRAVFMDVTSATNTRTVIASAIPLVPCGNKVPVLASEYPLLLGALLSSFAFDFVARRRMTGLSLNYFILAEFALPSSPEWLSALRLLSLSLQAPASVFAPEWLAVSPARSPSSSWRLAAASRAANIAQVDALALAAFELELDEARFLLLGDAKSGARGDPKGFWRVDKEKDSELRQPVLALVAFHDLKKKIDVCGGDRNAGIEAFLGQNDGDGWMLPETLRLADYSFGHDERARHPQLVASRLGPRFYDWQLAQSAEESWRECHIHARNLLGEGGFRELSADAEAKKSSAARPNDHCQVHMQERLFS